MKLLVLDSSGLVASVALIEDDQLIAEYTTGNKLTHSQTLLPMLDEVIKRTSFEIEDIDAVAVAKGPGSFTGLRIGAATAKGLGAALDKPIIPCANCRWACISVIWNVHDHLSNDGCQKKNKCIQDFTDLKAVK